MILNIQTGSDGYRKKLKMDTDKENFTNEYGYKEVEERIRYYGYR